MGCGPRPAPGPVAMAAQLCPLSAYLSLRSGGPGAEGAIQGRDLYGIETLLQARVGAKKFYQFEAHHRKPLRISAGFPLLCWVDLGWPGVGGSLWDGLSVCHLPGFTLTMVTGFLSHLSATANMPSPLSVSGKWVPQGRRRLLG